MAALAVCSAAHAADIAPKAPRFHTVDVSPTWSGFYAGANAGYGFGSDGNKLDGAVAGLTAGYNYQSGLLVLGVEADGMATGQRAALGPVSRDIPWLSTVRGRAGAAFGNVLIYGTGGLAVGNYETSLKLPIGAKGCPGGCEIGGSTTAAGWAAGGGAEWMFAPNWSVKAEYIETEFKGSMTILGTNVSGKVTDGLARGGINYHF